MTDDPKLVRARLDAQIARERLLASAHMLQARVAPSRLASDALATARERGTAAIETLNGAARRKPALAAGIAAALGVFLLRKPLGRLLGRLRPHKPPPAPRRLIARPRNGDDT